MPSEIVEKADFSILRYAQCWEDADILTEALDIQPMDRCLSIASAGDNTLAMLAKRPAHLIAVDLSPSQLACLELRVAAFRALEHAELLELIGSSPSDRRLELYRRCRSGLSEDARRFWDGRAPHLAGGIGSVGKFECYFASFRRHILPLIHSRRRIERLFDIEGPAEREAFYQDEWNNRRWRLLFKMFFSRHVMGRFGRDPSFFRYVDGKVAERILERAHYALTVLEPKENPYLQWILYGSHKNALPCALREENFDVIRNHLDRLEWRCQSIEDCLDAQEANSIDAFNLSDIFEYMSEENYHRTLEKIITAARPGARLTYWNMLVRRRRPEGLAGELRSLDDLAGQLHVQDKAFFYRDFVVEEVV